MWLCAGKDAVGPLFDGLSGDEQEVLKDFNEDWGTDAHGRIEIVRGKREIRQYILQRRDISKSVGQMAERS